jgi:hypothetical protein
MENQNKPVQENQKQTFNFLNEKTQETDLIITPEIFLLEKDVTKKFTVTIPTDVGFAQSLIVALTTLKPMIQSMDQNLKENIISLFKIANKFTLDAAETGVITQMSYAEYIEKYNTFYKELEEEFKKSQEVKPIQEQTLN